MPDGSERARSAHRRYASEHAGDNAHRKAPEQPSQYRAPPYRRDPGANTASNGDAYESSALEGSNEHIAQHKEVSCAQDLHRRKVSLHSSMCAAAGTGNHTQILGSDTMPSVDEQCEMRKPQRWGPKNHTAAAIVSP